MVDKYRDLDIWKKGMEICEDVYRLTAHFPKDEQYGMITQMRRSAVSIPSNIAEGFGRRHVSEFKQYISIAKGSLNELSTQTELAGRIDYLDVGKTASLLEKTDHLGRMLTKFYQTLK
jgi:four helix bundle protein